MLVEVDFLLPLLVQPAETNSASFLGILVLAYTSVVKRQGCLHQYLVNVEGDSLCVDQDGLLELSGLAHSN